MSRNIILSSQFKRDIKKQYLELATSAWAEVLGCLLDDTQLAVKYKDHALAGNWAGCRDCHIKPDLVLIYEKRDNDLVLIRLGSHAAVFG